MEAATGLKIKKFELQIIILEIIFDLNSIKIAKKQ